MHLTFPTATIASIHGVAFLSTSNSHQVAASISVSLQSSDANVSFKLLSKAHNNECLFVNAFKKQEIQADVGILKCGAHEICVEDFSSSLGGRCVVFANKETSLNSRRQLIACKFANNTDGVKCEGLYACDGVNETLIGCGSCIGDFACSGLKAGTTVSENSCVEDFACVSFGGSIGDNCCMLWGFR